MARKERREKGEEVIPAILLVRSKSLQKNYVDGESMAKKQAARGRH
jgi:hypothetical protein